MPRPPRTFSPWWHPASCNRIDVESYLRDLFRVLSEWPRGRYLELAPRDWAATRAHLDPAELARPLGRLTIPAPPTQQSAADCSG